jgi:mannose-1-phosphate guanylyltransferase/mannose-6-phosphate isomerase
LPDGAGALDIAVRPVVLCGGSGSRLWPLSKAGEPKQLLVLHGRETMLEATVRRCAGPGFEKPTIVTAEEHRLLVSGQLANAATQPEAIILEPERRNTAAAIALACHLEALTNPDQLMLVVPADHVIADDEAFRDAVGAAAAAAEAGGIVTFGVEPTRPETGFGYIQAGRRRPGSAGVRDVECFVEKPDAATARRYVAGGKHFWNAGILLAKAGTFIAELGEHAPDVCRACEDAVRHGRFDAGFFVPDRERFLAAPSESIDYAVMEKTHRACVLPVDMRWSDLGSWDALWEVSARDSNGNAISGDVVALETSGCLIRSEASATVAALGVSDLVIVATADALLVAPRAHAQFLKPLVDQVASSARKRAARDQSCSSEGGSEECDDVLETNRIILSAGQDLSLVPRESAAYFIVVAGIARVAIGTDVRVVGENECALVPAKSLASIENPTDTRLELLEVRCSREARANDLGRVRHRRGPFPAVA